MKTGSQAAAGLFDRPVYSLLPGMEAFDTAPIVDAWAAEMTGKGKDGKEAEKGPEAVPVEVVNAGRRSIAASYMGTAPLEATTEPSTTRTT